MESKLTKEALEKAEKIQKLFRLLDTKEDEIIDKNDGIELEDFKEVISQQCDNAENDLEPQLINECLDEALKTLKKEAKTVLTNTFVKYYYEG